MPPHVGRFGGLALAARLKDQLTYQPFYCSRPYLCPSRAAVEKKTAGIFKSLRLHSAKRRANLSIFIRIKLPPAYGTLQAGARLRVPACGTIPIRQNLLYHHHRILSAPRIGAITFTATHYTSIRSASRNVPSYRTVLTSYAPKHSRNCVPPQNTFVSADFREQFCRRIT